MKLLAALLAAIPFALSGCEDRPPKPKTATAHSFAVAAPHHG